MCVALGSGAQRMAALGAALQIQCLLGAGQRVSLGMDQAFDFQRQLNLAATVKPLAGTAFVRFQLGKLRFPEPQDISFKLAEAGHIPYFEVQAIRNLRRMISALVGELRGHKDETEEPRISRGRLTPIRSIGP